MFISMVAARGGVDKEAAAMRGTTDKAEFDKFVGAVVGFPPNARDGKSAQQVFEESYAALDELVQKAVSPFPRAIAWKAYALALSVYEGWPLPKSAPEAGWSANARLDEAAKLGQQAIKLDDTDYDLHWAMADVHLFREEFADAKKEFERALDLNRDERHPSLFAEAASAMMQVGDLGKAETYFRKARIPDWHHWMKGVLLFLKAGRTGVDRETFLNLALEELKGTRNQFGDDFYQSEIDLILAAVHWRKWQLLSEKASTISDPDAKALVSLYAARNLAAAERKIHAFRAAFPYWTADQAITALSLQDSGDQSWWRDTVKALWAIP
jgi:tetratricopeptide (TPR) repeat protein